MAGVKLHYCRWGSDPVDSEPLSACVLPEGSSVTSVTKWGIGNVAAHPADPQSRCQPLLILRALVALLTSGCSWCIRPCVWEGIFPPAPWCAAHVFDVKGQRRCRKGCKVCSQIAHLLLSLQAPVERWMAQSLGHQALVKETGFIFCPAQRVLWDKFSACKMRVTVLISLESYQEEKCIRQCWTPDALEGAESYLLL